MTIPPPVIKKYSVSSDDDFSSRDSSSSGEEDTSYEAVRECNIFPHFKDIATAIRTEDVNGLHIAIDNLSGNIDEHSIDGETALHYACICSSQLSFEVLVERGANIEAKNQAKSIPLHTACELGLFKIVEFIFNIASDIDTINRMLYSVNMFDETPLHASVAGSLTTRSTKIFKLLLNIETDNSTLLRQVDMYGDTPLHSAALYGTTKTVKLLVKAGASTEISNKNGQFPYELARPNTKAWKIMKGIH